MLLPVFCPNSDTSNYSFLQKELLNKINQMIDAVNNGHEYWLYSEEECYFIHETNSNLRDMRSWLLIRKPRKKKIQYTREQSEQLQQSIHHKQQWQLWLKNQCVTIHECLKKVPAQHKSLKKLWEHQHHLVSFNHASICAIAAEILPKLIKHNDHASHWLEWQQILHKPKQILLNYRKYIDNFQQAAKNLQNSLADSMLLRLIICDERHFTSSDPVVYFTDKLEINGLLKDQKKIDEPDQLTDKEFNYFHWYIEKYGSSATKKGLLELSWYTNQHTFPCKLLTTEEGKILIPSQISLNVPNKRYRPNWLFRSKNLRLSLAQSSTYLIALMNKRREMNRHFIDLTIPQSYQYILKELHSKELYLENTSKLINRYQEKYNSFISILLFDKTRSYLANWQNMLSKFRLTLFEDKLNLCEMLLNSVISKSNDNRQVIYLDIQSCNQLESMVNDLEQSVKVNTLSISLKKRLESLMVNVTKIISFNKALQIFDNISNEKYINADDYQFLLNYIESVSEHDPAYAKILQEYMQPHLLKIQQKLLDELKAHNLQSGNSDAHIKKNCISCYNLIIAQFGTDQMRQVLAQKIKKYFFNYLQELHLTINNSSVHYDKQTYLDFVTDVLKSIGNSVGLAGKTILQHVEDLQNVRETSKIVWQIRCYSLIMTLADEFIEKRFNKEAKLLDEKLFGLLQSHERLGYSNSTIKILQTTRCKMIDQQVSCATFAANLPKAEQVLMGINYPDSAAVQDIIIATADVYKTQKDIQNTELDPIHKIQRIKTLGQSVGLFLHQHPLTKGKFAIHSVTSNLRPWFSKFYLKEEMIDLAKHSMNI